MNFLNQIRQGLVCLFCLLLVPAVLQAQTARGTVTGVVKDSTGAVIPGATVIIVEQNTGIRFTAKTQADGVYLAPNLLSGHYRVSGEATGFKRVTVSDLKLDAGTTLTQDLTLELGALTETVTVSGMTSLVETTSGMLGTTIGERHILELPLANRQIFSLMNLTPGVINYPGGGVGNGNGGSVIGPGTRIGDSSMRIDGVENSTGGVGVWSPSTPEVQPPPETLQEFRVQTNSLSAEYGNAAVVSINAVTKGGTNQYHGDAYWFIRNNHFDAAGWGVTQKPLLQQNIAGGTLGGPIKKNKLFFFASYEKTWRNQGRQVVNNVGLPEWRTGNFSTAMRNAGGTGVLVPIYDPATGRTQQFPGNIIPASRLDPASLNAVKSIPNPNQTPVDPITKTGNFQIYPTATTRQPYYSGRVDYEVNAKTNLFARYSAAPQDFHQWAPDDLNQYGIYGGYTARYDRQYNLNLTRIFTPTLFLNLTAGVQRNRLVIGGIDPPNNIAAELGIPNIPGHMYPQLSFGGGLVPVDQLGGGAYRFQMVTTNNYLASFTKIAGRHTIKFGVGHSRYNNNDGSYTSSNGRWVFNGTYTQGVGANGLPIGNTGINFADFLLGQYTNVGVQATPTYGLRPLSAYVQDDWRVTPSLTLNLGVRWETLTPVWEVHDRYVNFDPYQPNPYAGANGVPAGTMGAMDFQNRGGNGKYLWDWFTTGFGPRFGFAYRVLGSSRTVIRGGYGIFFNNPLPAGTSSAAVVPFGAAYSRNYTPADPSPKLSQGIPATGLAFPLESALNPGFGTLGTAYAISSTDFNYPDRAAPYVQSLNLTLQHQWRGVLLEAGYMGTLGRHLGAPVQLNNIPPQLLSQTSVPARLRRPFPQFTGNNATVQGYNHTVGVSGYNALTLKTEQRFRHGVSWVATFVSSKWLENVGLWGSATTPSGGGANLMNIYNLAGEKARSENDVTYRLVFSPIVELPFGKGRHWLNYGGVPNAVLGGWQVALLGILQGGSPLGPSVLNGGNNILGDPNQTERPNIVSGCNLMPNAWQPATGGVRGIQYVNSACFANPAAFTYGNQSRTVPNLVGPGMSQFNVTLSKSFQITERLRMQFRAEAIDLFNTPQFNAPALSFGSGTFGIITGANATYKRTMDLALKLHW